MMHLWIEKLSVHLVGVEIHLKELSFKVKALILPSSFKDCLFSYGHCSKDVPVQEKMAVKNKNKNIFR